jgi:hypothetical protein
MFSMAIYLRLKSLEIRQKNVFLAAAERIRKEIAAHLSCKEHGLQAEHWGKLEYTSIEYI